MRDLLNNLLKLDEARGHWRDWSELFCSNLECEWRGYKKDNPEVLKNMKCPECGSKLELRESVDESSIDFPQKDLDLNIWDKENDTYKIKSEVKGEILNLIGAYGEENSLLELAAKDDAGNPVIHIPGSIGSNLWVEDSDIDVHIVVDNESEYYEDEDFQSKVIKWFNDHRNEIHGYIGNHPVEVYLQFNSDQDLMSTSCYDLMTDEWLVGPEIKPLDYNPYEDFSGIVDTLRDAVDDADKLFGELRRDVIDYDTIKKAMAQLAPEQKELFLERLKGKLDEVEEDIQALYSKRKEWTDARKSASKPSSPEEALKDVELAKKWKDTNAEFKFVNRYKYLKVIQDLEKLLNDNEISPDEVDDVKRIMKDML